MKKLRVSIDGKAYEVLVEILDQDAAVASAPAAAPLAAPAAVAVAPALAAATAPPRPAAMPGAGVVVSPLAGKMVSIDVKIGQMIVGGAQVATIEAMKMNTFVYAPQSGRVAEVMVNPGDGVEEGAPLLRLA